MVRIIGLILILLLFPTCKTSAVDVNVHFQLTVKTGEQVFYSKGGSRASEEIPISVGLKSEGWQCILSPRQIIDSEVGQGIVCVNANSGAAITSIVRCDFTKNNSDSSNFILDNKDPNVTETIFALECSTRIGESI